MKYAILAGDTVVNVAIADGPLSDNWILIDDLYPMPGIGWKYINGAFSEAV